jgi:uncharacterized protein (DUF488 family)
MEITICTIGFAGKTAEQFFTLLSQAGVKAVIDVRENRIGQLSGFAKYPDIEYLLDKISGVAYAHEPRLAPSVEIRKAYRETKDWSLYETSFLQLMRERGIPQNLEPVDFSETFGLLCSEPGPEKCHRRLVADILAEHLRSKGHAVQVQHLETAKREKPKRGKVRHPHA